MAYKICDLICTMYNAKIGVSVCFSSLGVQSCSYTVFVMFGTFIKAKGFSPR